MSCVCMCARGCHDQGGKSDGGDSELARPFTQTGAGQFDVDLEALKHFFGEHSSQSLRRVFSRLSQVRRANCSFVLLHVARVSSTIVPARSNVPCWLLFRMLELLADPACLV